MSDILNLISAMRQAKQADTAILEAVIAIEAAREHKLAQRRAGDSERQRRHRAKKTGHVTSRDPDTVTRDAPLDGPPSPVPPSPPLSPHLLMAAGSASEPVLEKLHDLQRNRGAEILAICRKRAEGAMANIASMHDITPILHLMAPAVGKPCDLEADILPVIDRKAAEAIRKGVLIRSWDWVRELALRNRDRRLSGNPSTEMINERVGAKGQQHSYPGKAGAGGRRTAQHGGGAILAAALRRYGDREGILPVLDDPQDA